MFFGLNTYILHLLLILILFLCIAVIIFGPKGGSKLYIASGGEGEKHRMVRRSAPITAENMVLIFVGVICIVALYLTNFNLCVFTAYWFPGLSLNIFQGLCK